MLRGKELVSEWEGTEERNLQVYVLWGQIHKAYFLCLHNSTLASVYVHLHRMI